MTWRVKDHMRSYRVDYLLNDGSGKWRRSVAESEIVDELLRREDWEPDGGELVNSRGSMRIPLAFLEESTL